MNIKLIKQIIYQIGGPITLNSYISNITLITDKLVAYHEKKIDFILRNDLDIFEEYDLIDFYSLYFLLEFIIKYLGKDEFHAVIGENIELGYLLLEEIKEFILGEK